MRLYVRFDPTVNGNGGGGAGNGGRRHRDHRCVDRSPGPRRLRSGHGHECRQPRLCAAGLRGPRRRLVGRLQRFRGSESDGLTQLDASHALTMTYLDAEDGNVVQVAQVGLDKGGEAELALGFGATQDAAVGDGRGLARTGTSTSSSATTGRAGSSYDKTLNKPRRRSFRGLKKPEVDELADAYYLSANVLKASEDKTFPGAIVASLASPWGQAISAGDPSQHLLRLVPGGVRPRPVRGVDRPPRRRRPRHGPRGDAVPVRSPAAAGRIDAPGTAWSTARRRPTRSGRSSTRPPIPILMADQLGMTDATLYGDHIRPAADFLAAHGPAFGVERWEEQSGYSPSTIAAEIAGLVAAAHLAEANGDPPRPPSGSASLTTCSARSRAGP